MWNWLQSRGSAWVIRAIAAVSVLAVVIMVAVVLLNREAPPAIGTTLVQESVTDSSYNGRIVLTNPEATAVQDWTVELELPGSSKITKFWDSAMSQSGTTYTFTGLTSTRRIEPGSAVSFGFSVEGTDKPTACRLNSAPCAAPKDDQSPTPPGDLRVAGVTVSSVSLAWDEAVDNLVVVAYKIYGGTDDSTELMAGSPQTDAVVTGLTPGTPYQFKVTAIDAGGNESPAGKPVTITTAGGSDTEKPSPPTDVRVVSKAATSVQLSWKAGDDNETVGEYRVYVGREVVGVSGSLGAKITGLNDGGTYKFEVVAVDAAENESKRSDPVTVTLSGADPTPSATKTRSTSKPTGPPGGVLLSKGKTATASSEGATPEGKPEYGPERALDGDPATRWASKRNIDPSWLRIDLGGKARLSRVKLTWDKSCAIAYAIETSDDGTVWKSIYTTTSGDGEVDEVEVGGVGRYVQVVGKTRCRPDWGYSLQELEIYGSLDTDSNGSDKTPPSVPKELTLGVVTDSTVGLSWTASTDDVAVAGYDVYHDGNLLRSVPAPSVAVALEGLSPNTKYRFTVLARDAAGNTSQASNMVPATTTDDGDTSAPDEKGPLRTTSVTPNSVTLKWDEAVDNGGKVVYDVYVGGAKVGTVEGTCVVVTGLAASTIYKFHVKARDDAGNNSPATNTVTVKTAANGSKPQAGTSAEPTPGDSPRPPGGQPGGNRIGQVSTIATDIKIPWGVTFLPSGDALVGERDTFTIYRVTAKGDKHKVGRVPNAQETGGEGGLLGLALSPAYASDKMLYAYHTASSGNQVVRMRYDNDQLGEPEVILTGIAKNRFHNGGRIIFGPDKLLYIGTGDAQSSNNAQNKGSLNGKILRVTPDGKPAPGNPFGTAVYSMGHRNVQGLWFDAQGRLWASEFGNSEKDEVNQIQPGKNYGWPTCEGKCGKSGFVDPAHEWPVAQASPSGLCIVGDAIFMASLRGTRLWRMRIDGSGVTDVKAYFIGTYGRLRTVLPAPDGSLWLTTSNTDNNGRPGDGDDKILRIALE